MNAGTEAERFLPGGVLGRHVYPAGVEHIPVSGKGAWITDETGRRYVDYSCGGGSLILGYGHPAIVAAIQQQAGTGDPIRQHHQPTGDHACRGRLRNGEMAG